MAVALSACTSASTPGSSPSATPMATTSASASAPSARVATGPAGAPVVAVAVASSQSGMDALLSGTLKRVDGCLVVANESEAVHVVWPKGTTVETTSDGRAEVRLGSTVLATEGGVVSVGGGFVEGYRGAVTGRECLPTQGTAQVWTAAPLIS